MDREERNKLRAAALLEKLEAGSITESEMRVLDRAFVDMPLDNLPVEREETYRKLQERAWRRLQEAKRSRSREVRFPRAILAIASVALLTLAIGFWVYRSQYASGLTEIAASGIAPGTTRATLTLADGQVMDLDEAKTGIVIGIEDITYDDGVSAVAMLQENDAAVNMLSLTTPKGGTYHITLPDGSKVWLNANSQLKYPSRFGGEERVVTLAGEAYFDISRMELSPAGGGKARLPFKVITDNQTVEVLGTQFNLSAYRDEKQTRTTLVEGSVRINALDGASLELVPGEQGTAGHDGLTKEQVDTYPYIAWQRGYFSFADELQEVLAQLGRWYDLDVEFRDDGLKTQFVLGNIQRNRPLSEVLRMLEEVTDARFAVLADGKGERRIAVMR